MCSVATHVKLSVLFQPVRVSPIHFFTGYTVNSMDPSSLSLSPTEAQWRGSATTMLFAFTHIERKTKRLVHDTGYTSDSEEPSGDVHKRNGAAKAQFKQRITLVPLSHWRIAKRASRQCHGCRHLWGLGNYRCGQRACGSRSAAIAAAASAPTKVRSGGKDVCARRKRVLLGHQPRHIGPRRLARGNLCKTARPSLDGCSRA